MDLISEFYLERSKKKAQRTKWKLKQETLWNKDKNAKSVWSWHFFLKRYLCSKRGRPDLCDSWRSGVFYLFIYLFIYGRGLCFNPSKWQINDFHVSTWLPSINITRMLHMHCSSKFHSTYLYGFLLTLFKSNWRSEQCCVYTNDNYPVEVIQYRPRFLRCW